MVNKFWKIVNNVIDQSDIMLLVLDSRMAQETRNIEIEDKVKKAGKPLIYVITKTDLVSRDALNRIRIKPCAFVSAKDHQGTKKLRNRIMIEGKKAYKNKTSFIIGVMGYPNVGKSSLINAMKGKKSAKTSPISGYTKAVQKIRGDNKILFFDTPGVIPYKENDKIKHALIGGIDYNQTKDPDLAVIGIMKAYPGVIEKHYGIPKSEDFEESIEKIAEKKNLIKKGKELDIIRASRMILKDWQRRKEK